LAVIDAIREAASSMAKGIPSSADNLSDCGGFIAADYREARRNALSAFDEQADRRRVDSPCRVQ